MLPWIIFDLWVAACIEATVVGGIRATGAAQKAVIASW